MEKEDVVRDLSTGHPSPVIGHTLHAAPDNLSWFRIGPAKFAAIGPKGGRHHIGMATHRGSPVISYGPK